VGRRLRYRIPLDTSLFTPLQLQPTALGRIGFNAGARWLAEHVCSHRRLIADHGVGFVLWAWQLRYRQALGFLDADDAEVEVQARVRGPRAQVECEVNVAGPQGVAVEMRATMIPLKLTGDPSLSGAPCRLPQAVVDGFAPEELERAPYRTPVPRLVAQLEGGAPVLARGEETFAIARHHCEIADQWFWAEALGFASAAREELVVRHGRSARELLAGLSEPMRSVDVVATRNYQFRDVGTIATTAYLWEDRPVFVHRLALADDPADATHAIAVERF
jgi:hypothetical protein